MNPSNKIKEIQEMIADYCLPNSTTDAGNLLYALTWSVNRVKVLTEALEEISKDVYEANPWTVGPSSSAVIARKALESEE